MQRSSAAARLASPPLLAASISAAGDDHLAAHSALGESDSAGSNLSVPPVSASTKSTEAYGFVLWIATYVAYVLFALWAFVPERFMHHVGVTYYPSKYWALAIPAYACATIAYLLVCYLSVNLIMTNALHSCYSYTDSFAVLMNKAPRSGSRCDFEEIMDIPIEVVNKIIYQRASCGQTHQSSRAK